MPRKRDWDLVQEPWSEIQELLADAERCSRDAAVPGEINCELQNFGVYSASTVPNDEGAFHWMYIAGFKVPPPPACAAFDGTWVFDGEDHKVKFVPRYFHPNKKLSYLVKQREQHLPVDEARLRATGAVSAPTFRRMALDFAMTKSQWLATNGPITVLSFDRNWEEYVLDVGVNPRGQAIDAKRFFTELTKTVVPSKDHLEFVMRDANTGYNKFTLQIEASYHRDETGHPWWMPIEDGVLPASEFAPARAWEDLPGDTLVGFRGPFVPLEALSALPAKVYWSSWWDLEERKQ